MLLPKDPLAALPDPLTIHERLSQLHHEQALLKRMLKLSVSAQRQRDEARRQAGQQGGGASR